MQTFQLAHPISSFPKFLWFVNKRFIKPSITIRCSEKSLGMWMILRQDFVLNPKHLCSVMTITHLLSKRGKQIGVQDSAV